MSGFASLEPAFTIRLTFDAPIDVGTISSGCQLQIANINGGTIKSEPGFSPAIEADVIFGSDHVIIEPGFKHLRVNVKAVSKTKDGKVFNYTYRGIVELNPECIAILMDAPDAKTTQFGNIFTAVNFVTGAEELKALETSQFVGCSRFVKDSGQPTVVESSVSKVVFK